MGVFVAAAAKEEGKILIKKITLIRLFKKMNRRKVYSKEER